MTTTTSATTPTSANTPMRTPLPDVYEIWSRAQLCWRRFVPGWEHVLPDGGSFVSLESPAETARPGHPSALAPGCDPADHDAHPHRPAWFELPETFLDETEPVFNGSQQPYAFPVATHTHVRRNEHGALVIVGVVRPPDGRVDYVAEYPLDRALVPDPDPDLTRLRV